MFCPQCGSKNVSSAQTCANCMSSLPAAPRPRPVRPFDLTPLLLPAILVTLFCCQPFGIVGIVFAAMASSQHGTGDLRTSAESARKAQYWTKLGFWCGLIPALLYLFFVLFAVAARR